MECTQRLEADSSHCERICPDQIGFLGILGTKYPVVQGPNKVGRDPQTCKIVLNLNSISRQHAVINILSGSEFMLMDLDSANKTKLNNKTLQPYLPAPMSNGDTVQFGDVFGVFRLLADNTELPATQAMDIPDTPVASRSGWFGNAVIPESPDVSDRDESFVVPSQPISRNQFKSPSEKFIKASSKIGSIQPVGSKKIDNVYWNSSKQSTSFNLDDSLNESNDGIHEAETQAPFPVTNECDIHEAATQAPIPVNNVSDIHEAETQAPLTVNNKSDSIYTAATQIPSNIDNNDPSIHNLETQLPELDHLPAVCKINNQEGVEIDLFANKDNDNNIFNAETQLAPENSVKSNIVEQYDIFEANTQLPETNSIGNTNKTKQTIFEADTQLTTKNDVRLNIVNQEDICEANTQLPKTKSVGNTSKTEHNIFTTGSHSPVEKDGTIAIENNNICKTQLTRKLEDSTFKEKSLLNQSDEIIIFDELDTQSFAVDFQSQPLLPTELNQETMEEDIPLSQTNIIPDGDECKDVESYFEEYVQKKPTKRIGRINSDSLTDCDDFNIQPTQKIPVKPTQDDDSTDCEEEFLDTSNKTEKISNSNAIDFEDLPTQVIAEEQIVEKYVSPNAIKVEVDKENFEDILTQVLPASTSDKDTNFEDLPTQVLDLKIIKNAKETQSPFKVPFPTPLKNKKKDISKTSDAKGMPSNSPIPAIVIADVDDDQYYNATQELLEDLCSQTESSLELVKSNTINTNLSTNKTSSMPNDEIDGKDSLRNLEMKNLPKEKYLLDHYGSNESVRDDKVEKFVNSLSANQIKDVIGVNVANPKRAPSDPSDVEVTPKKVRPCKFLETELPSSQEIKTSVSSITKSLVTESSSESETENDSQENTPVVFRKRKRVKVHAKKDLLTKFDVLALPSRIITRTRKPTPKIQESDLATKNQSKNILKPKFLTELDDDVDSELITENITRIKNENEKKSIKDNLKDTLKVDVMNDHDKNKVNDDSKVQKASNKQNNETCKNTETTIDLTVYDDKITAKSTSEFDKNNTNSSVTAELPREPRKRRQNDKSTNKNADSTKINEVKVKKSKNLDTNVDLTVNNEEITEKSISKSTETNTNSNIPAEIPRNARSRRHINNSKIKNAVDTKTDKVETEKVPLISKSKPRETRKTDKLSNQTIKKETQGKITNYTISKPNESKSVSKSTVDESLNSTDVTSRSTRSTRSRNKDNSKTETKTVSPEDTTKRRRAKPNVNKKKDSNKDKDVVTEAKRVKEDPQPKEEVRRSKRQRHVREKEDSQTTMKHEQSTVYNISSDSCTGSPKSLKRGAMGDVEVPSAKRTKSILSSATSSEVASLSSAGMSSNNSSRRSTPSRGVRPYHVLFTAIPFQEVQEKLENLGAIVVSEAWSCSVVLTMKLRRTVKLLCAVGLGRPVVGPAWVQACVDNNALVDPWEYLLKDEENEQRFQFNLQATLTGPRNYLKGFNVSCTPSVQPGPEDMKSIVECSGGAWREGGPHWACVSHRADAALWPALRRRGARLVSSELVLTGVLRQRLDIDAFLLK